MQRGLIVTDPKPTALAVAEALRAIDGIPRHATLADMPLPVPLAMLAGGRLERVRDLLRVQEPTEALPLVAARYVSWTGDLRIAAALWDRIRAAAEAMLRAEPAGPAAAWLRSTMCSELQRTATDVGDPMFAASLHRHARMTETPAASAEAVGSEVAGDGNAAADGQTAAARTVLDFVHHALGVEPDATRHRLRLRPRMHTAEHRIGARQIRFGDGSVVLQASRTLNQDRHGDEHYKVRVAQDAGAIPLTVLLEPIVRGTVRSTRVDGTAADLAPRTSDGGTIVPVQLVLDEERCLEVDTARGRPPE